MELSPELIGGTFVGMGRKGPNVRFGSEADMTASSYEVRNVPIADILPRIYSDQPTLWPPG